MVSYSVSTLNFLANDVVFNACIYKYDLDLHSTLTLSFQPKNGEKSSTKIFWI